MPTLLDLSEIKIPKTCEGLSVVGDKKRDFLYVDDAINAILLIMKKNRNYNAYNVGSEKSYSINKICSILKDISKKNFIINASRTKIRKNDSMEILSNSSKLKKLGWKAKTSVPEGFKITYNWYLNNSNS